MGAAVAAKGQNGYGNDPRMVSAVTPYRLMQRRGSGSGSGSGSSSSDDEQPPDYKQLLALLCGVAGLILKVNNENYNSFKIRKLICTFTRLPTYCSALFSALPFFLSNLV